MKRKFKDRIVSAVLALTMVASLLPAGLITPAHAAAGNAIESFKIYDDGTFEIVITGSPYGAYSGGIGVLPNFTVAGDPTVTVAIGDGSGLTSSHGTITSGTQSAGAMSNQIAQYTPTGLKSSAGQVSGNFDASGRLVLTNAKVVPAGAVKLEMAPVDSVANLKSILGDTVITPGEDTHISAKKASEFTSFPYTLIFTPVNPLFENGNTEAAPTPAAATLVKKTDVTASGTNVQTGTGSVTATGDVIFDSIAISSLVDSAGNDVSTGTNVRLIISGSTAANNGNALSGDHNIVLTLASSTGNVPVTGSVIINWYDKNDPNKTPQQCVVPVKMGTPDVFAALSISEAEFTVTKNNDGTVSISQDTQAKIGVTVYKTDSDFDPDGGTVVGPQIKSRPPANHKATQLNSMDSMDTTKYPANNTLLSHNTDLPIGLNETMAKSLTAGQSYVVNVQFHYWVEYTYESDGELYDYNSTAVGTDIVTTFPVKINVVGAAATTYNVTLNANNGTFGSGSTVTLTTDGDGHLKPADVTAYNSGGSSVPTRSGYTFAGWNTQADGKGTDVALNTSATYSDNNTTYYAKWTKNPSKFKVKFHANDGTAAYTELTTEDSGDLSAADAASVTPPSGGNIPTRTGYKFKGWYDAAGNGNGTGANAVSVNGYTKGFTADDDFYAHWDRIVVTFHPEGGTWQAPLSGTGDQTANPSTTDGTVGAPGTVVKANYAFKGWYTAPNGGTKVDLIHEVFKDNDDLYAQWGKLHKITYQDETATSGALTSGALPTPNPQWQTAVGGPLVVYGNTGSMVKTGYYFAGWEYDGQLYGPGTSNPTVTIPESGSDITLTAKWLKSWVLSFKTNTTDTVTQMPDDVSGITPGTSSATQNDPTASLSAADKPQRANYTFLGWGTSASSTTADVAWPLTITGDTEVFAVWKELPYVTGAAVDQAKAGATTTLQTITTSDKPSDPHAVGTVVPAKIEVKKWVMGGSTLVSGAPVGTTLGNPGDTSVNIPAGSDGLTLWVLLAGKNPDYSSKEKWVSFTIGSDKVNLTVAPLYLDEQGNVDGSANPGQILVNPSSATPIAAGDTKTVETESANNDYQFLGWSTVNTGKLGAGIAPEYTNKLTHADGWTLDGYNPSGLVYAKGKHQATFTAPGTLTSTISATVYAVYQKIPTYSFTMNLGTGIDKAVVNITRNGTVVKTVPVTSTNTTVSGMRADDVVTITSTASDGYYADKFTVAGTTADNYTPIGSATQNGMQCNVKGANVVITANAKPNPALVLTPTDLTDTLNYDGTLTSGGADPKVTITNTSDTKAIIVSTTYTGDTNFTKTYNPANCDAANTEVLKTDSPVKTVTFDPDNTAIKTVGTYPIKVTVVYKDPDYGKEFTAETTVNYKIADSGLFDGTVTVKKDDVDYSTATVTLAAPSSAAAPTATTKAGNVTTFTNITKGKDYAIHVDLDGDTNTTNDVYVIKTAKLNDSSTKVNNLPNVTVEFYTVTAELPNSAVNVKGLTKAAGAANAPTLTLSITSQMNPGLATDANATAANTTKALTAADLASTAASITAVVQKGDTVTFTAAESNLATSYFWGDWSNAITTNAKTGSVAINAKDVKAVANLKKGTNVAITYHVNYEYAKDNLFADPSKSDADVGNAPTTGFGNIGSPYTITSTVPTIPGFAFVKWNTKANGTGTNYTTSQAISKLETTTPGMNAEGDQMDLWAVWEDVKITTTKTADTADDSGTYGTAYTDTMDFGAAIKNQDGTKTLSGALKYAFATDIYNAGGTSTGTTTTANYLPGGLGLKNNTAEIFGVPFEVCTDKAAYVVITLADDYHDNTHKISTAGTNLTYTMSVGKAQPTITNVTVVNATLGKPVNTAEYDVTVTGPRMMSYGNAASFNNPDDDVWQAAGQDHPAFENVIKCRVLGGMDGTTTFDEANAPGTITVTATKTDNSATSPANTFVNDGSSSTKLTVVFAPDTNGQGFVTDVGTTTPSNVQIGSDFDGYSGNTQDAVWLNDTETKIYDPNFTYDLQVTEGDGTTPAPSYAASQTWQFTTTGTSSGSNPHVGYAVNDNTTPANNVDGKVTIGSGTAADTINAKQYTVKNTGTGTVTIKPADFVFSSGNFELVSAPASDIVLKPNETYTFKVQVKSSAVTTAGTPYTGTLTVNNQEGGNPATVGLTVVLDAAKTFDFYIQVNTHATDGTVKKTKQQLPTNTKLTLTDVVSKDVVTVDATTVGVAGKPGTPTWITADSANLYKVTLETGSSYQIDGYSTANTAHNLTTINAANTAAAPLEVNFYELKVEDRHYEVSSNAHTAVTFDASSTTGTDGSGLDGWYLAGQSASIVDFTTGEISSKAYRFDKWHSQTWDADNNTAMKTCADDTTGAGTTLAATVSVTGPVIYHAFYVEDTSLTVTLTYEKNIPSPTNTGLTGDNTTAFPNPTTQTVANDANKFITISSTAPERPGFVFEGWAVKKGNSTTDVIANTATAPDPSYYENANVVGSTHMFGSTLLQPGNSISLRADSNYTLYAIWSKGQVSSPSGGTAWNPTVPNGTYGVEYSTENSGTNKLTPLLVITDPDPASGNAVKYSSSDLTTLTGLTLNEDGTITGRPFKVADDIEFNVTATHYYWDNSRTDATVPAAQAVTKTAKVKISIKPYQLVLNSVGTEDEAANGARLDSISYDATVATAPWYGIGGNWMTISEVLNTKTDSGVGTHGTLTLENPSDTFASGVIREAHLKYTPKTSTQLIDQDAAGQDPATVYLPATGSAFVAPAGVSYAMELEELNRDGSGSNTGDWTGGPNKGTNISMWGPTYQDSDNHDQHQGGFKAQMGYEVVAADDSSGNWGKGKTTNAGNPGDKDQVYAQTFRLRNTKPQTIASLDYKFMSSGNKTSTWFDVKAGSIDLDAAPSLAYTVESDVKTFNVVPNAGINVPGKYPDTLVIIAKDDSGNEVYSVSVNLSLEVTEGDLDVEIVTYLWDIAKQNAYDTAVDDAGRGAAITSAKLDLPGTSGLAAGAAVPNTEIELVKPDGTSSGIVIKKADPAARGEYTASIPYSGTYYLKVNGVIVKDHTLTNPMPKTLDKDNLNIGVYLYEVTTHVSPAAADSDTNIDDPTVTNSAGQTVDYIVFGDNATITADTTGNGIWSHKSIHETTPTSGTTLEAVSDANLKTTGATWVAAVSAKKPLDFTALYTNGMVLKYHPTAADVQKNNGGTPITVTAPEEESIAAGTNAITIKDIAETVDSTPAYHFGWSRDGYTFGGWAISPSAAAAGTVTFAPGDVVLLTNTDLAAATSGSTITLYAVWKGSNGLTFDPADVTLAHKQPLTTTDGKLDNLPTMTTPSYTITGGTLPSNSNVVFDPDNAGTPPAPNFNTGSGEAEYDSADPTNNTGTVTIKASDASTFYNISADVTVTIIQAETEVPSGKEFKPKTGPSDAYYTDDLLTESGKGNILDLSKLDTSALQVIAKNADGTTNNHWENVLNTNGFDETHNATDTDPTHDPDGGVWKITKIGSDPVPDGTPVKLKEGTNTYELTFYPNDPGFRPCTTTVEITASTKVIKEMTLSLVYPKAGDAPVTTITQNDATDREKNNLQHLVSNGAPAIPTIGSLGTNKTYEDYAKIIGKITWDPNCLQDKSESDSTKVFKANTLITAYIQVEPNTANGWTFADESTMKAWAMDYGQNGVQYVDGTTVRKSTTILPGWSQTEGGTIVVSFAPANSKIDVINVLTTDPVVDSTNTTWSVPVNESHKYYVQTLSPYEYSSGNTIDTHWVKHKINDDKTDTANADAAADRVNNNWAASGTSGAYSDPTGNKFETDTLYDAIVVIQAQEGWEFDESVFGADKMAVDADITAGGKVLVNGGKPPFQYDKNSDPTYVANGKTYISTVTLSADRKTLVVRFNSFLPTNLDVTGIEVKGTPGAYYAQTAADEKHYSDDATGHRYNDASGNAVASTASGADPVKFYFNKSNITVYPTYSNGTTGTYAIDPDTYVIGKASLKSDGSVDPATFTELTNNYQFKKDGTRDDVADWDGKALYVRITIKDTVKYYPVSGLLTVKPLTVAPSLTVTTDTTHGPKLDYSDTALSATTPVFTMKADGVPSSVTANFNPDAPGLANPSIALTTGGRAPTYEDSGATKIAVSGENAAAKKGAGETTASDMRDKYYYMLDSNGDGAITDADTELVPGTTVLTVDMQGKDVYLCYTDVNGNLATYKFGEPLTLVSSFTAEIHDKGGKVDQSDPDPTKWDEPEHGDKLTGVPMIPNPAYDPDDPDSTEPETKPDPDPNKYEYVWIRVTPDPAHPDDPTKATEEIVGYGPDYVPDKDDVDTDDSGKKIKVVITDPDTGTKQTGGPVKIYPRSINFTVDVMDKKQDGHGYNTHLYEEEDFHPTQVKWSDTTTALNKSDWYGGVLLGDDVGIKPIVTANTANDWNTKTGSTTVNGSTITVYTDRPVYTDKDATNPQRSGAVGSEIIWPAVASGTTNSPAYDGGYTLTGDDAKYYRLAPQGEQRYVGKITDGTVTHVDVSFKEWPTFDHNIPDEPMGVTDDRETMAASRTEAAANEQDYKLDTVWYEVAAGKTFDPSDSSTYTKVTTDPKFTNGKKYAVAVSVKPKTGYGYNLDDPNKETTRFYFHFGEDQKVEVAKAANATTGAVKGLNVNDGKYTMYYTFDQIARPKIAYVNTSVAQPTVGGTPSDPSVIQTIDVNGDLTSNASVSAVTWTGEMDGGKFKAGVEYTAEFTVTSPSGYEYLFGDDSRFVSYTASGIGALKLSSTGTDNDDSTPLEATANASGAIKNVTISTVNTKGKTEYKVKVVYNKLTGGPVDLLDVIVNAPVPKKDVVKTEPTVATEKPYALASDSNSNKWFYWKAASGSDPAGWAEVTNSQLSADGKFLPGYEYKVTAKVELEADKRSAYRITKDTNFYLAGLACKTTEDVSLHNDTVPTKTLSANKDPDPATGVYPSDTVFTLTQTFAIPAEAGSTVSITYNLPLMMGDKPAYKPDDNWADKTVVDIDDDNKASNGTKWAELGTTVGSSSTDIKDAAVADFTKNGTAMNHAGNTTATTNNTFKEDNFYRVEGTITEKGSGFQFTDGMTVVINGVAVKLGANDNTNAPTAVKDSKGSIVAYVRAYAVKDNASDANDITKIIAQVVAKAQSDVINPIELKHDKIIPEKGKKPSADAFATLDPSEDKYEVDKTGSDAGKGIWYWWDDTAGTDENSDGKPDGDWVLAEATPDGATKSKGLDKDGNFLPETIYSVVVKVKTKDNNSFAKNGTCKGTVEVVNQTYNAITTVASDQKSATLRVTFDKTPAEGVQDVTIVTAIFNEPPKAAETIDGVYYAHPEKVTREDETVGTLNGQTNYSVDFDVQWYDLTASGGKFEPVADKVIDDSANTTAKVGTKMTGSAAFEAGKKYAVVVKVQPADGFVYNYPKVPAGSASLPTQFFISVDGKYQETGVRHDKTQNYWEIFCILETEDGVKTVTTDLTGKGQFYVEVENATPSFKRHSLSMVGAPKTANTANNDPIPGGLKDLGFTFTAKDITLTYDSGKTVTYDADNSTYGKTWGLFYTDNSGDRQLMPASKTFAAADMENMDGKGLYLATMKADGVNFVFDEVVYDEPIVTLDLVKLAVDGNPEVPSDTHIQGTVSDLKLTYNDGDQLKAPTWASGKPSVTFNTNDFTTAVSYDTTAGLAASTATSDPTSPTTMANALALAKTYYYKLDNDWVDLNDGAGHTHYTVKKSDYGKHFYVCYTDVNGKEVKRLLGALTVDGKIGSIAINYYTPTDTTAPNDYINYVDTSAVDAYEHDDATVDGGSTVGATKGTKWYDLGTTVANVTADAAFTNVTNPVTKFAGEANATNYGANRYYRVQNDVEPKAGFTISNATKVVVDGYEVTADGTAVAVDRDNDGTPETDGLVSVKAVYTAGTSGAKDKITVYAIYHVPAILDNEINSVSITYPEPEKDAVPDVTKSGKTLWTYNTLSPDKVSVDENAQTGGANAKETVGSKWYKTELKTDPSSSAHFTTNKATTGTLDKLNGKFEANTYYMVDATIKPADGYAFKAGDTKVTINGVLVTVAASEGASTVGKKVKAGTADTEIGWAIAFLNADGTITARYIAKTKAADSKVIVKVNPTVEAPVSGKAVQKKVSATYALNEDNANVLTNGIESEGAAVITWYKNGTALAQAPETFEYSTKYSAEFTLKTTGDYKFLDIAKDTTVTPNIAADYVDFIVNGYDAVNVNDGTGNPLKATITIDKNGTESDTTDDTTVEVTRVSDAEYKLKINFPATKANVQTVTDVHVDTTVPPAYKQPIPGVAVRDHEPYEDAMTNDVPPAATAKWQSFTKDTNSDGTPDAWEDVTTSAFENGVKYRVTAQVKLKNDADNLRDFDIGSTTKFWIGNAEIPQTATGTVTVGGVNCATTFKAEKPDGASGFEASTPDGTTGLYDDTTVYTVTLEFPALEENKTIVKVIANVPTPVAGDPIVEGDASTAAVDKVLAENEDGDDVTDHAIIRNAGTATPQVTWKRSTDKSSWYTVDPDTEPTFIKDYYYSATFYVDADTANSYQFLAKDTDSDSTNDDFVDFLINGVVDPTTGSWLNGAGTVEATSGIKVETAQDSSTNKYKVTVTFPKTKDTADVLTVWGLVTEPMANDPIDYANVADIDVPDSEPYEIKNVTDKYWEHWDTATSTWVKVVAPTGGDPAPAFKPGEKYRANLTVIMKTAEAAKYQFTNTTAGYVNTELASNTNPEIIHNMAAGTITLKKEYTIDKLVTDVHVSSAKPTAGNALPTSITVPSSYAGKYEFTSAAWSGTLEDGKAKEGETYTLTVTVKALGDYVLPTGDDVKSHYIWDQNNAIAVTHTGDGQTATVTFTYELGGGSAQPLEPIIGIEKPEVGNTPKMPTSPNNSVTIIESGTKWTDKDTGGNVTKFEQSTEGDKHYHIHIQIDPARPDGVGEDYKPGDLINLGDGSGTLEVKKDGDGNLYVEKDYTIPKKEVVTIPGDTVYVPTGGGGGGTEYVDTPVVTYALLDKGITNDLTAEKVKKNKNPKNVPNVKGIEGLKFLGWSETDPSTIKDGKLPTLVDPTTFKITKDKTFYAVYEQGVEVDHNHYVIGFPNGTFAPDAKITRAEVATIVARSCLSGFVEGANYGNPGNYTDCSTHWAFSAIAFCAREGVFNGYEDGTFRPDRYITRQELATVVARLAGIQQTQGLPFSDSAEIANWALNGVYTAYANGWVNGYEDGTFKPERDISRAETVKIFNGYLKRGVNAKGLEGMKEYVHQGVASHNTENGHDEYMTWPDVPKTHWAYYEIIEAANDHNYHWQDDKTTLPPETWEEVYINEKWRYNDNANDGAENRDQNMNAQKTFTVTYLVSSNGQTYDAITETVERFASPKPENLPIAVPNPGYRFAGWSSTDPSTGTVTLVDPTASSVTADKWYYAVFEEDKPYELPKYTVTYVIGAHGSYSGATVETVEMYQAPSVAGLPQVKVEDGWYLAGWSETDPTKGGYTIVDPTANYVTSDKTFYAVYAKMGVNKLPIFTATYIIGTNGTYGGATVEQVEMFQSPSVDFIPHPVANAGYRFVGWSETDPANGNAAIMDPTANYLTADKIFYAVYQAV